jgi:hypothetical protein
MSIEGMTRHSFPVAAGEDTAADGGLHALINSTTPAYTSGPRF